MKSRHPELSNGKRVGIWIRVSTEDQARGDSPEHHEHRARSYAEAKGWTVVEVYHLEGVSGKAVSEHPETKRMLADVRRGHIGGLIFSKLARLARNTKELLEFADWFKAADADLISLQESIDTSTPAGRLFYTMIAAMAQWEREEIVERIKASIPVRAELGKRLGGAAPFGYQWQGDDLVPEPAEAPVLKLMYELFAKHRRKKTVCRMLNEAGYRTRAGVAWTDHTLHRLLLNTTSKGLYRCRHTASTDDKGNWKQRPESEWVFLSVEALVPEELWDECARILAEQRRKRRPAGPRPVHLFAGLLVCDCGNKMYVPSNTLKYVCQKCRTKIPITDLEGIYYEQLKGYFLSPEDVAAFIAEADETIRSKEELCSVLTSERDKLKAEMDAVYRLYLDGHVSSHGFGERYQPLEERMLQLREELPRLQAETDIAKINLLSSDAVLAEATDLYSRWPQLSFEEKRTIIEHITQQIVVAKDGITITLAYLPFAGELVAKGPPGVEAGRYETP